MLFQIFHFLSRLHDGSKKITILTSVDKVMFQIYSGFYFNTHCLCRDHLDQLDLLAKMEQMDSLAPLDPLDLVDVLEKLVLLYVTCPQSVP